MAGPRRIDWGTAVVEDCTLEVELTGSRSKDWSARFERVVALLETPHSGWGRVFLESAVIEANSELDGDGEPDRRATEEGDRDPAAERDRRMTETFRAFAAEQREPAR